MQISKKMKLQPTYLRVLIFLMVANNFIIANSFGTDSSKIGYGFSVEFGSILYLKSEFKEIKYKFSYDFSFTPHVSIKINKNNIINAGIGFGLMQFNRKNRDLNYFNYYDGVNFLEINSRPYKDFKFNYVFLSFRLECSKRIKNNISYMFGLDFNIYELISNYGQTTFLNPYYVPYDPSNPNSGPKYGPMAESQISYYFQNEFYSSHLINGIELKINKHLTIQGLVYFDILNMIEIDSGFNLHLRNNYIENNGASYIPIHKFGILINYSR